MTNDGRRKRYATDPVFREKTRARARKWGMAHRTERTEYSRKWRTEINPERWSELRKKYVGRLKNQVLDAYGRECACCGETVFEFLSVDHINGDGYKHRKEVGNGTAFYVWLRRHKFPEGFRILCMNCNHSRGIYGYCPHEKEKETSCSAP